jgi:hypothetical protein
MNLTCRVISLLATCGALALSGCGVLNVGRATIIDSEAEVRPNNDRAVVVAGAIEANADDFVGEFAVMALFSKVVYRKDLSNRDRERDGCLYMEKGPVPTFGMPSDAHGYWSRWVGDPKSAPGCVNKDGLYVEVYVHRLNGLERIDQAVIAYRGTENYKISTALPDWESNFAAGAGLEPHQYVLAQHHLETAISKLVAENTDVVIYATGHSLGGGLAQQAAYLSRNIRTTYAFDPSPVTNWSNLVRQGKVNKYWRPEVKRIYHWHEGLAYIRNVTSRFNLRTLNRSDYEFYFQDYSRTSVQGAMSAHEIGILACHFAKRLSQDGDGHGYSKAFASNEVMGHVYDKVDGQHPICPSDVILAPPPEIIPVTVERIGV